MKQQLLLVALCVSFVGSPAVASAEASSAQATAARLGRGIEVSTVPQRDTKVRWGRAVGVVDEPFEVVQRVVTDYARYHEFLPHFNRSRVLSRRGPNALVYLQASVVHDTVTLWAQTRIFARRPRGDTQVIEARMLDGNMRNFAGRWELTPVDGGSRTLVAFQLFVDPDLPLPDSVFTKENRKGARKTLEALRRRAHERTQLAQNR